MISPDLLNFIELMAEATDQPADEILEDASQGQRLAERQQLLRHYDDLCQYIWALRSMSTAKFALAKK